MNYHMDASIVPCSAGWSLNFDPNVKIAASSSLCCSILQPAWSTRYGSKLFQVNWGTGVYPLVNVYITMERSTMLSMGKLPEGMIWCSLVAQNLEIHSFLRLWVLICPDLPVVDHVWECLGTFLRDTINSESETQKALLWRFKVWNR